MNVNKLKIVFWDFDGVIKDSVDVKTDAFMMLFAEFGKEITKRVQDHHIANGGMSRFQKIPLYAGWAGLELTDAEVHQYSNRFSELVVQKVIESSWVPGVEHVLFSNPFSQKFILVSATPQEELLFILDALKLKNCFQEVYGSPMSKKDAIEKSLQQFSTPASDCLMIGDARADLEAAQANQVMFLLRLHNSNAGMTSLHHDAAVHDFFNYESLVVPSSTSSIV